MPKVRGRWEEANMKRAMESVISNKMTIRVASQAYSVPRSSLGDRVKLLRSGAEVTSEPCTANKGTFQKTFDENLEHIIYNHIVALDNQLMPLSRDEFLKLVYQLAEKMKIKHRFNKDKQKAGKDFYYYFMRRHQELSLRTAESTSLQRAAGFNKAQVNRFFDKLFTLIEKYKFSPSDIFNADETGVSVVHGNKQKVMSVKGKKQVGKLTSAERGRNVTVLLCINASGDLFVPPLFVYPRVRIDQDLKRDAPPGSIFDGQKTGWITAEGFLKWLHLFVDRVKPNGQKPVLLILDGHSSHKDLNVITYAKENNIHMLSLPPHTSHKLQPLDRAIMKPFKNCYNEACALWMRKYPNLKISLNDIAGLVNTAFSKICRMELAQKAFKCTGIHPFDRDIFSDLDYSASLINNDEEQCENENRPPVAQLLQNTSVDSTNEDSVSPTENLVPAQTSTPKPSAGESFLFDICPLPSESNVKFKSRGDRGEQSEVLTSTPFKNKVEEKKRIKKEKEESIERKKKTKELKIKSKLEAQIKNKLNKNSVKRSFKKKNYKTKSAKKTLNFDDGPSCSNQIVTYCIHCGECFEEDWIQCSKCKGWSHEDCANLEGEDLFYLCDTCKV